MVGFKQPAVGFLEDGKYFNGNADAYKVQGAKNQEFDEGKGTGARDATDQVKVEYVVYCTSSIKCNGPGKW